MESGVGCVALGCDFSVLGNAVGLERNPPPHMYMHGSWYQSFFLISTSL